MLFLTFPVQHACQIISHLNSNLNLNLNWFEKFYKFVGMSNGYSDAMIRFTKILRPVFGNPRLQGYGLT